MQTVAVTVVQVADPTTGAAGDPVVEEGQPIQVPAAPEEAEQVDRDRTGETVYPESLTGQEAAGVGIAHQAAPPPAVPVDPAGPGAPFLSPVRRLYMPAEVVEDPFQGMPS